MSFPGDKGIDETRLSTTSKRLVELREQVLTEWEKRVREEIAEAGSLPHPIVINTFPVLYDYLVQAVNAGSLRRNATDGNTVASEHGGERARLTRYSPQSVVAEYQVLRWTILDVLARNQVELSREESDTINASIDFAIRDSVAAFVVAQATFRQQIVAAVSHDLRTPLGTASLLTELLQHHADHPAKVREFATKLKDHLGRMDRMIKEFLNNASAVRSDGLALNPVNFDLLTLAHEVRDNILGGARLQVVGGPTPVCWDREAVKRVMENLVSNAMKYGDRSAPISIELEQLHERVMVSVHNEGDPIAPDELPTLFKAFRRTTAASSGDETGWGIGLQFVRTVAESHGGSISVDSADDRGTTFLFDLPRDSRPFLGAPVL